MLVLLLIITLKLLLVVVQSSQPLFSFSPSVLLLVAG